MFASGFSFKWWQVTLALALLAVTSPLWGTAMLAQKVRKMIGGR